MAKRINLNLSGVEVALLISKEKDRVAEAGEEALYKTAKRAKSIASRVIRKYLNLPKAWVDSYIWVFTDDSGKAIVKVRNKPDLLSNYPHRQHYKGGRYKTTGNRRKAGLKIRIWKGKPPVQLKHTFYIDTGDKNVASRKGKARFPVTYHRGPGVGSVLLWAEKEFSEPTNEALIKEFDRALKRAQRGY